LGDGPEFTALMAASGSLHHPWSNPPTDLDSFASLAARTA
jgi:hypothetical protein